MPNFDDNFMGKLFDNAHKQQRNNAIERPPVKDDLSEEEAIKIYNEIIDIMVRHNLSYKNACRIVVSMAEGFLQGAVELYENQ